MGVDLLVGLDAGCVGCSARLSCSGPMLSPLCTKPQENPYFRTKRCAFCHADFGEASHRLYCTLGAVSELIRDASPHIRLVAMTRE